jgi:hypothetical protein
MRLQPLQPSDDHNRAPTRLFEYATTRAYTKLGHQHRCFADLHRRPAEESCRDRFRGGQHDVHDSASLRVFVEGCMKVQLLHNCSIPGTAIEHARIVSEM